MEPWGKGEPQSRAGEGTQGLHVGWVADHPQYQSPLYLACHDLFRPAWGSGWDRQFFKEHRNVSGGFRWTREELEGKLTFTPTGGTHSGGISKVERASRGLQQDCPKEVPTGETSSPATGSCISTRRWPNPLLHRGFSLAKHLGDPTSHPVPPQKKGLGIASWRRRPRGSSFP